MRSNPRTTPCPGTGCSNLMRKTSRLCKTCSLHKAPFDGGPVSAKDVGSVVFVTRGGSRFAEWQSYSRAALIPLSEELGLEIQEIPLRHKRLRIEEDREQEHEQAPTANKLYRISQPIEREETNASSS